MLTLTCTFDIIVAGSYAVIVKTELGNLNNNQNLANINVDLTINKITPAIVINLLSEKFFFSLIFKYVFKRKEFMLKNKLI